MPDTVIITVPAAVIPSRIPPSKSKSPGVSMIFTFISSVIKLATAVFTDTFLLISSGSKSQTVFPSDIFPRRSVTPALKRSASASDVLPEPLWPARAMFLIVSAFLVIITFPLYVDLYNNYVSHYITFVFLIQYINKNFISLNKSDLDYL